MKIWRCSFHGDPDLGNTQSWHPSKAAAMAARRELAEKPASCEIESVDIPTDKAGLIGWLNDHFNTDNG